MEEEGGFKQSFDFYMELSEVILERLQDQQAGRRIPLPLMKRKLKRRRGRR